MKPYPVLPPVETIHEYIKDFLAIDLSSTDVDSLKKSLEIFFRGYMITTPALAIGQLLYRGVKWKEKPTSLRQVSHPPPEKVLTYQRVNRPGQPVFYSSIAREGAVFELRPASGDHLAVSKWKTTKKIILNNVGYTSSIFQNLGSTRALPSDWGHNEGYSESNKLVADFFSKQFTRIVSPGNEHEYKLCTAIAEKHYIGSITSERTFSAEYSETVKFGGLVYPTISMKANADNIVLLPEIADNYLTPLSVEWLRVDAEGPGDAYQVTKLDFANSFGSEGEIEWKGRLPHWQLAPGQMGRTIVENGHWVMRDGNGELVEPT
jgi:hypothetical protein